MLKAGKVRYIAAFFNFSGVIPPTLFAADRALDAPTARKPERYTHFETLQGVALIPNQAYTFDCYVF
jgi:hypothetical protein